MAEIVLIRHGQTEWSATGQHTSYTDIELTEIGEQQARALADRLSGRSFAAVISSPRLRARHTAELAGLTVSAVDDNLAEWNYGSYEGLTSTQIEQGRPDWWLWTDGAPGGEQPEQVGARLDQVLARADALLAHGDVALIAHGHSLRMAGARWIGLPASAGGLFGLDTATLSVLGHDHGRRVIRRWNS